MGWGDLVSSLPVVGGLFDNSGDQARDQIKGNQGLWQSLKLPELNWEDYKPEAYNPESAQANTVAEDPMVRGAQMSALAKMAGLADTGLSDVDAAGFQQAKNIGNQVARQATQSALQNAQARGAAGSGLEFAMRQQGSQDAAQRAQDAGLQQAAESARQRALANTAYMNALSGVRGQDYTANSGNADILNRFNMYNTTARNQAGQQSVDERNRAQVMNSQGRRDVQQQNFNNQVTRAGGQAQANTNMANAYYNQNAARQSDRNQNTKIGAALI